MPRPRKLSLVVRPSALVAAYANGHSTRSVARTHGVSRWQVTQAIGRLDQTVRSRDEQVDLQAHAEVMPRCPWPDCSTIVRTGICPNHQPTAVDGGCGWPRCTQAAVTAGLCYWHNKRAAGAG